MCPVSALSTEQLLSLLYLSLPCPIPPALSLSSAALSLAHTALRGLALRENKRELLLVLSSLPEKDIKIKGGGRGLFVYCSTALTRLAQNDCNSKVLVSHPDNSLNVNMFSVEWRCRYCKLIRWCFNSFSKSTCYVSGCQNNTIPYLLYT